MREADSLIESDGVVAFWLLYTCGYALAHPEHADSARVVRALGDVMAAAVRGGAPARVVDELGLWLRTSPRCPRAAVLAVVIGHALPVSAFARICDNHLDPVPFQ